MFDQLPVLVVVTVGDDQRLVAANAWGRAAIGERAVGEPIGAWLSDQLGQGLMDRYVSAWRTGETYTGHGQRIEVPGTDGAAYPALFDLTIAPVTGDDGAVRAVVLLGHDVTDVVRARAVVAELHDAVLPKGLPVPQRVALAARYLLVEDDPGAGGDWFDAIPLPDGRVAVVVGDVVGHGVEASVVMGELKALFEESVRADGDVAAALALLDRRAARVPEARAATVCAGVFDPASSELTYCTAGHPPPALLTRSGSSAYLPATGAGPLGSGLPFGTATRTLAEGDLLLLYSDGLTERPGRSTAQNTVDLLRAADAAFRGGPSRAHAGEQPAERVVRQTVDVLTRHSGYTDDISVLALQVVARTDPLELHLAAVPDSVRTVRADLDEWLARLRISAIDRTAVQHAVAELVANVVEHAYPAVDVHNTVHLRVSLSPDGVVDLVVADDGAWREPAAGATGRGLSMVGGFLDEFRVERDDAGTAARGRHRVSHPAPLLRGSSVEPVLRGRAVEITTAGPVVRVSGALDLHSAEQLRGTIARASSGGTRPVTVDLTDVDLLCSAGVQVLYDVHAVGGDTLVAPMGSPAQHVLDLVGLPYTS